MDNPVYEGDIVTVHGSKYIVEWDNDSGKYVFSKPSGDVFKYMSDPSYNRTFGKNCCVVMGNIHQNNYLLIVK